MTNKRPSLDGCYRLNCKALHLLGGPSTKPRGPEVFTIDLDRSLHRYAIRRLPTHIIPYWMPGINRVLILMDQQSTMEAYHDRVLMAYLTNGTPVNANSVGAGETPDSTWFSDLSGALNHAHAYNTAQPINQGWPDGRLDDTLGSLTDVVATWRIPSLGTAHSTLWIEVDGKAKSGSGGTVELSSNSGNSVSLNFGGGRQYLAGNLTIDTSAAYDEIVMKMTPAGVGDSVVVYGINSAIVQPGAAGLTGSRSQVQGGQSWVHPLPTETTADNHPASSFLAHAYRDTIDSLTRRPRSLVCWSGIAAPGQSACIKKRPLANTNRCWIVRNQVGSKAALQSYTIHAQLKNATNAPKTFGVELMIPERSQDGTIRTSASLTVPANTNAPTWITGAVEMPEHGRIPTVGSPISVHSFTSISIAHSSDVECSSLSIWGE